MYWIPERGVSVSDMVAALQVPASRSDITSMVSDVLTVARDAPSYLVDNPTYLAALLLILVFLAVLVYYTLKWYFRKQSDGLVNVIKQAESVSILMHENPDPDAMACALGLDYLADQYDTEVTLEYPGRIQHHENRAFRAVLDVSFETIHSIEDISGETVILVDHHRPRGFDGADEVEVRGIIDHHEYEFTDATIKTFDYWHDEPDIGACSTLVTEYLLEQGFHFNGENNGHNVPETIATALLYGVMSDTSDLTQHVDDRDYQAAMRIYKAANGDKLHRISTPKIDANALEIKSQAISNRVVEGPFAVSYVNSVNNQDAIPQAADELMQLEGVSAVVVFGVVDDNIQISARAYDDRVHVGEALRAAVEELTGAEAGGHSEMAGGQVPTETLDEHEISIDELRERFFDVLNGKREFEDAVEESVEDSVEDSA